MRASLLPWLLVSSLACSKRPEPEPDAAVPLVQRAAPAPAPKPAPAPRTANEARIAAPANGCAIEHEAQVGPATRGIALELAGDAVLLAHDQPAAVALWQRDGTHWREGLRLALDAPLARASADCDTDGCDLAFVDQRMRLMRTRIDGQGISKPTELALGVDRRFAPAIARHGGRVLVAYTTAVNEAMHTRVVGARGAELAPIDVTPAGHGAAAPVFVLGAQKPTLVAIDAHAGVSPLLEIPFDVNGAPQTAIVRTPVSQPYAPPQLAAVQWTGDEVEVMYTAIGKLAMTAIGRVPLRRALSPTALSASRGYGELSFAVARSEERALFVFEVPVDNTPNAERSLTLALTDGKRTDQGPTFAAPARSPSLIRTQDGYLLAFTRAGSAHVAVLRCAD